MGKRLAVAAIAVVALSGCGANADAPAPKAQETSVVSSSPRHEALSIIRSELDGYAEQTDAQIDQFATLICGLLDQSGGDIASVSDGLMSTHGPEESGLMMAYATNFECDQYADAANTWNASQ